MKIPNGLGEDDLDACLKLRDLLDNDFIDVVEYNERIEAIIQRSSLDLETVAKQMEAESADAHLDEFSRVLADEATPNVRATTVSADDELLKQIGLADDAGRKKKTIHDEGLSKLDTMLRELGGEA